jgi:nitrate/nitrite transport system substrate-binding protein
MRGGTDGARQMSTFDDPFDPSRRLNSRCACGRHRSHIEHDREAEKRYEGVVASAVMRAVFPKGI